MSDRNKSQNTCQVPLHRTGWIIFLSVTCPPIFGQPLWRSPSLNQTPLRWPAPCVTLASRDLRPSSCWESRRACARPRDLSSTWTLRRRHDPATAIFVPSALAFLSSLCLAGQEDRLEVSLLPAKTNVLRAISDFQKGPRSDTQRVQMLLERCHVVLCRAEKVKILRLDYRTCKKSKVSIKSSVYYLLGK